MAAKAKVLVGKKGKQQLFGKYGKKRLHGKGLWDSITSGLSKANDWLKDNKVISSVANTVGGPWGSAIGSVAGHYGYGRKGGRGKPKRYKIGKMYV